MFTTSNVYIASFPINSPQSSLVPNPNHIDLNFLWEVEFLWSSQKRVKENTRVWLINLPLTCIGNVEEGDGEGNEMHDPKQLWGGCTCSSHNPSEKFTWFSKVGAYHWRRALSSWRVSADCYAKEDAVPCSSVHFFCLIFLAV